MDMSQHIRESNLIEGIDSVREDNNSIYVWNLIKHYAYLDNNAIQSIQGYIVINQTLPNNAKGFYRSKGCYNVQVGSHIAPHYYGVPQLMSDWLDLYSHGAEDPIKAHIAFEHIHPFLDGNGRTGRMLLWWHEIKNGQEPTLFLNSEKFDKYYPLFEM